MRERYDPCKVKCLEDQLEDLRSYQLSKNNEEEEEEGGEVIIVELPSGESE